MSKRQALWPAMASWALVILLICILMPAFIAKAADAQSSSHERADRYASALLHQSRLPASSLAIIENDTLASMRTNVGFDALFILGSTTKSMTALAILQLAETGKLRLDDPVTKHLPLFLGGAPQARAITLRMLLHQTSGISHEAGDQPVLDAGDTGPRAIQNWSLALRSDALNRVPGVSFEYSNANYVVLGAIVEVASGQSYRDYMREHVFAPLGMIDTYASLADAPRARLTQGHKMFLGRFIQAEVPYPPAFVPAGFVISSVQDIAKYLAAQLPGASTASRLGISAQAIEDWHRGVAAMDPDGKSHYAMGWATDTFNGLPVVYHSGDTGTFASEFTLDLENRRAVVLLTNGSSWQTSPYVQEISSGVINILAGREPRDDAGIHTMASVILSVVLAIPVLLLIVLSALWLTGRPRSVIGRAALVLIYASVAVALLYVLPREIMGIPLTELVISMPDMGLAALATGVAALGAVFLGARRQKLT